MRVCFRRILFLLPSKIFFVCALDRAVVGGGVAEADGEGGFCGGGTEIAHFGGNAEAEIEQIGIGGDTEAFFEFADEVVLVEADVGGKLAHGEVLLIVRFDVFNRGEDIVIDGGGELLDGKKQIEEGFKRAFHRVFQLLGNVRTAVIGAVVLHRAFHQRKQRGKQRMLVKGADDGRGGDQGRRHDEVIEKVVQAIVGVLTDEKGQGGREEIEAVFLQLDFLVADAEIGTAAAHVIKTVGMRADVGDPFARCDTAAAEGQSRDGDLHFGFLVSYLTLFSLKKTILDSGLLRKKTVFAIDGRL